MLNMGNFCAYFRIMRLPRHMVVLFCSILLIVPGVLGWNGYQVMQLEKKAVQEQADQIIQAIALKFQYANFTNRNMAYLYSKEDAVERIAFAAGITQNKGKIGFFFDDTPPRKDKKVPVINMRKMAAQTVYKPELVQSIDQYKTALLDSLQQKDLQLRYTLHREKGNDRLSHSYTMTSTPFIINVLDPVVYHVDYYITGSTIFHRMLPYLLISLLIILLLCGALRFYVRSYQAQIQMIRFREALFGNITHELKTPLSSLQLIFESAGKQVTDTAATISKEHVDFAGTELKRMQLLVDKILSFGKLTPEQFDLDKTYLHLDEIIRESIYIMQLNTAARQPVAYQPGEDVIIPGDKVLLTNMLTMILDNALKYANTQPEVTIALNKAGQDAVICIRDNGIGIAPVYHKKVFEPFFRIPTGNTHAVKGHGLGLSFVAQVIRLHNGTIDLNSTPGKGTTFTITLPSGKA